MTNLRLTAAQRAALENRGVVPSAIEAIDDALRAPPPPDQWQNAREQAQAQFESIKKMVATLQIADESAWEKPPTFDGNFDDACEDARTRIHEDALSVEVRSGWNVPDNTDRGHMAEEYRILLCTGGPAVQIMGELSEHGDPETARLMMQDWFLPWTEYRPLDTAPGAPERLSKEATGYLDPNAQEILLTYARQFYFGEWRMGHRKITQIAINHVGTIFAVCEDGTLWRFHNLDERWIEILGPLRQPN